MADNDSPGRYHFNLERHNKEVVRDQATKINRSLKRIRTVSLDVVEPVKHRNDEPTEPFVTAPEPKKIDETLRQALEEAEQACRVSSMPPPTKTPVTTKRWYRWRD